MTTTKPYIVNVNEEQGAKLSIVAKNKEHAEEIAEEQLSYYGIGNPEEKVEGVTYVNVVHRETHVLNTEDM